MVFFDEMVESWQLDAKLLVLLTKLHKTLLVLSDGKIDMDKF